MSSSGPVVTSPTEEDRYVDALRWREQQYATLAEIGLLALRQADIEHVLDITSRRLREALDADFTKVLDHRAGTTGLLLRAGDGWPDGVVGHREVPEGRESQGGYTLDLGEPTIVDDLPTETRFEPPALLLKHGVRSGVAVLIEGGGRVLGVLQADKCEPHHFSDADVPVLQAYANVLGGAIAQFERERVSAEFAMLAAHELRTPLTALVGFGSRLLRHLDETGQIEMAQREEVEAICAESVRLSRSVELFLALGDAERRSLPVDKILVDLADIAEDVAVSVGQRFPDRIIRVLPTSERTRFATDELSIVRILTNLAENGVKYSSAGTTISISIAVTDAGADLAVSDACGGLAKDDLRRAFEYRFRGKRADGAGEGFGLGLYIAQRLAEAIGGDIEADSSGEGCTFMLRLKAETA